MALPFFAEYSLAFSVGSWHETGSSSYGTWKLIPPKTLVKNSYISHL